MLSVMQTRQDAVETKTPAVLLDDYRYANQTTVWWLASSFIFYALCCTYYAYRNTLFAYNAYKCKKNILTGLKLNS